MLTALALAGPLLPGSAGSDPGAWLLAGRDLLLLIVPIFLVYLAMKGHLLKDHADGAWASEVGAIAWVLAAPRLSPLTTGAALLFGAHLLVISGHRRSRPLTLVGAGAVLAGALVAEPLLLPAAGVVAVHGLFGGFRHLPRPRFNALSGRAVAGLGGFLLAAVSGGLVLGFPTLPALPESWPPGLLDPARLLRALVGSGGFLRGAPWVLLSFAGLWLWWKRGTRRGFLWVSLGVLLAGLLGTAGPIPRATPSLLLIALLPFLAGPTARLLSHLRERPGVRGPRLAGSGLGLVLAGAVMAIPLPGLTLTSLALLPFALLAVLLPGRASVRGRIETALFTVLVGGVVVGGLHLLSAT